MPSKGLDPYYDFIIQLDDFIRKAKNNPTVNNNKYLTKQLTYKYTVKLFYKDHPWNSERGLFIWSDKNYSKDLKM